jgi:hypothetical protein
VHAGAAVKEFYGAMGVDLWDRDVWRRELQGVEVAVLTPQVGECTWRKKKKNKNRAIIYRIMAGVNLLGPKADSDEHDWCQI